MSELAALLVVDVQYDFLPGGSLGVNEGDQVLPIICDLLIGKWAFVAASQDYHPLGHVSFASTHGRDPFTEIEVPYPYAKEGEPSIKTQMLWPDHCVQSTRGAQIESSVNQALQLWIVGKKGVVVRKGTFLAADAYSAFGSQPDLPLESSPLLVELRSKGITQIFVVGIATDYCVRASALDAAKAGFKTFVIQDAVRAVGGETATRAVTTELGNQGIEFISRNDPKVKAWL